MDALEVEVKKPQNTKGYATDMSLCCHERDISKLKKSLKLAFSAAG
jgi:hypothetical protein